MKMYYSFVALGAVCSVAIYLFFYGHKNLAKKVTVVSEQAMVPVICVFLSVAFLLLDGALSQLRVFGQFEEAAEACFIAASWFFIGFFVKKIDKTKRVSQESKNVSYLIAVVTTVVVGVYYNRTEKLKEFISISSISLAVFIGAYIPIKDLYSDPVDSAKDFIENVISQFKNKRENKREFGFNAIVSLITAVVIIVLACWGTEDNFINISFVGFEIGLAVGAVITVVFVYIFDLKKSGFRNEINPYRWLTAAVLATAVFFVCRIIYAGVLALPYPKEILEPSNIALTNTFLEGKSPYTLSSLKWQTPGVNFDYPFLNSLVAAGIALITGCGAVKAHFILSIISIILSGVIGWLLVKKDAKTTVAPALSAIFFMICHWRFGYISAAPDDFGLLLLLLTSYAAVSPTVKNKPVWCSIGITLCLYTKQYLVFVAIGLFVYMFLYSRKDAIKLFVWTLAVNIAVGIIITIFWPLYWIKAFLLTYLGTVVGGGQKFSTFMDQFNFLLILFPALFAIIAISAAMALYKRYRKKAPKDISESGIKSRFKENDVFAFSVIQSLVMLVPLLVIGRNDGAIASYFLQLWIPYIIIVALICFERMRPEKHEFVFMGIYAAVAFVTVYLGFGKLPDHMLTEQEIAEWQKAYAYSAQYREKGEVYYDRPLAYDYYENQNGDCVCGHDSEIGSGTVDALAAAGLSPESLYLVSDLADQNMDYREGILKKAADHEYSLITIDGSDALTVFDEDYAEEHGYRCIDRLTLQLGNMPYELAFFALN